MGAPLNKYGFVMSLWSMVFSPDNGCNDFFTYRSNVGDSSVSSQEIEGIESLSDLFRGQLRLMFSI